MLHPLSTLRMTLQSGLTKQEKVAISFELLWTLEFFYSEELLRDFSISYC